jgi:hypothetical protein
LGGGGDVMFDVRRGWWRVWDWFGDDKDGGEEGFLIVMVCMECRLCV